jgi:hypothetical protein
MSRISSATALLRNERLYDPRRLGGIYGLGLRGTYDPTGKTGLNTFYCKQVKGIECGDDYGEFVVTKLNFEKRFGGCRYFNYYLYA